MLRVGAPESDERTGGPAAARAAATNGGRARGAPERSARRADIPRGAAPRDASQARGTGSSAGARFLMRRPCVYLPRKLGLVSLSRAAARPPPGGRAARHPGRPRGLLHPPDLKTTVLRACGAALERAPGLRRPAAAAARAPQMHFREREQRACLFTLPVAPARRRRAGAPPPAAGLAPAVPLAVTSGEVCCGRTWQGPAALFVLCWMACSADWTR